MIWPKSWQNDLGFFLGVALDPFADERILLVRGCFFPASIYVWRHVEAMVLIMWRRGLGDRCSIHCICNRSDWKVKTHLFIALAKILGQMEWTRAETIVLELKAPLMELETCSRMSFGVMVRFSFGFTNVRMFWSSRTFSIIWTWFHSRICSDQQSFYRVSDFFFNYHKLQLTLTDWRVSLDNRG